MAKMRPMLNRERILESLDVHKSALRRLGVKRLGLFGSYAENRARPGSDLDFVVEFKKKSFDAYMELKLLLEDVFRKKVDLVLTDAIKPRLRHNILAQARYGPRL